MHYNEQLAQASYLVGCAATGEALVVDPTQALDGYVDLAEREGFRIAAVTETHIHADFVSGARELAARSGGRLYLSSEGTADWQYAYAASAGASLVRDGDACMVGTIRIEVMHTPGHTPEHSAFLLADTAGADEPMGIFTGDFVFVGDVGRPDLLERAAGYRGTREAGARQLYTSLQRFAALPNYLQVWPGHGAGSACGTALGAVPRSTAGYEKRFSWAFQVRSEDAFVEQVLAGQPNPPASFAPMKRINKEGPALLSAPASSYSVGAAARGHHGGRRRPADAYAGGHIPGTINLPLGASFVTWAGWLLPYDRPFALIADEHDVPTAVQHLRLIGLDAPSGYATSGILTAWSTPGHELATIRRTDPAGLAALLKREDLVLLDVRDPSEVALGAIDGSRAIPLGSVTRRLGEVPRDRTVALYCQRGMRSAITSSLLDAAGFTRSIALVGGFDAWRRHEWAPAVTLARTA